MPKVWLYMVKSHGLKMLGEKYDNTFPIQKVGLRMWLLGFFNNPSILDCYGSYGKMYRQVWQNRVASYQATEGDALKWLNVHDLNYDLYDVDPWGSPWEALDIINQKSQKQRIGIVCTDGALKRVCMIRAKIPKILIEKTGWDKTSRSLKAEIFYHYPIACRQCLALVMSNYRIEHLAIKEHQGIGTVGTVYFAAILQKYF